MEDVLDVYELSFNPDIPVVCMDEKPYQLLGEARDSWAMRPGDNKKIDSEYVRNGTCSIFAFIETLAGKHYVSVREYRTAIDWAEEIKYLVDVMYPDKEKIILVMDNLNTHKNRWIDLADRIPWNEYEIKYADLFPSETGNVAKPLRMALGALIIQKKFQFSDRELVEQITENPYLQYFIGLKGYQEEAPFDASTLVLFRKRISMEMLIEANEYLLEHSDKKEPPRSGSGGGSNGAASAKEQANQGTVIVDATCAPSNIRYPKDVSLLNESREKLECMIYRFCKAYRLSLPRRYRRIARKDYLSYAKSKKHTKKQICRSIRKQLSYVGRDLRYLEGYMSEGYAATRKEIPRLHTIMKVYEQQRYMYEKDIHKVENRIVSISQPWLRPIVRGKVKAPVEFGAKLEVSLDSGSYARIEKISFEAYNESGSLQETVERYYARTGCYPKRVLADQIYRTRGNLQYCKERGIRLSGKKLGRPVQSRQRNVDRKREYQDNTDRIEIEREFSSVEKHSYGLGLITTKLEETQLSAIALSVFVSNLFKIQRRILDVFLRIGNFWCKSDVWAVA